MRAEACPRLRRMRLDIGGSLCSDTVFKACARRMARYMLLGTGSIKWVIVFPFDF